MAQTDIQLIMPVHNEAGTIEATIREFDKVARGDLSLNLSFLIAEDGSSDDSAAIVRSLANEIPIRLLSSEERKGYSRAVAEAFSEATSQLIAFVDSDGQYDPSDLGRLVKALDGVDLVTGYRSPRLDSLFRKLISRAFRLMYEALFPVRLRDPSSPYLVVRREVTERFLRGNVGVLEQGFWWEFYARAMVTGVEFAEVPVTHRPRPGGGTRVYRWWKLPRITINHLHGLFLLRRELTQSSSSNG